MCAQLNIAIAIAAQDNASGPIGTIKSALGGLADIAGGAVSVALGMGLVNALGAATGAIGGFFGAALDEENVMAKFDNQLRLATDHAASQATAYAAASASNVTHTALSAGALEKLNDKYAIAKAKLDDMLVAYPKLKHPTETQTLALQNQKEAVQELADKIAAGGQQVSGMAGRLGDLAPQAIMSRSELINLAMSMRDLAGGSKDAEIGAEAVLLKFQTLGKDNFPAALQMTNDLAAQMGISLPAAAQMLGKALEVPGQGLAKLKAAGVETDKAFVDQIKTMEKHGDTAGAQKLILDALAGSIGGTAKALGATATGQWTIFTHHIEGAGKSVLEKLLPAVHSIITDFLDPMLPKITALAGVLGDNLGQAVKVVTDSFNNFPSEPLGAIADLLYKLAGSTGIDFFNTLGDTLVSLPGLFAQLRANLQPVVDLVLASLPQVAQLVRDAFGWISQHGEEIKAALIAIGGAIAGAGIVAGVVGIAAAIAGLVTPVGLIIAAVGILGAAWAGNWGNIQGKTAAVWAWLQPFLAELWTWLQVNVPKAIQTLSNYWTNVLQPATVTAMATVKQVMNDVVQWVIANWPKIQATIATVIQNISTTVHTVLEALKQFWADNGDNIITIVGGIWELLKTAFTVALAAIYLIVQVDLKLISDFWTTWGGTIQKILGDMYQAVKGAFQLFADIFKGNWSALGTDIYNIFKANMQTVVDFFTGVIDSIRRGIQGLLDFIGTLLAAIHSIPGVPSVPSGLGAALGADFIVPSGFPHDSFPMRVQSGEHVTVTPAGQSSARDNLTINIDARGSTLSEQQIQDAVRRGLAEAGYRADGLVRMGAI